MSSKRSKIIAIALTEEMFETIQELQLKKINELGRSITMSSFTLMLVEAAVKMETEKNK
jgi:hypothetical protein